MSVLAEAPRWAVNRAIAHQPKYMDESSLIPLEQLPKNQQRRQEGVWLAYYFTLSDPRRDYVYGAAVDLVSDHAKDKKGPFTLVDLGAGNGWNTHKSAQALQRVPNLNPSIILVEQSGTALVNAQEHFRRNGFPKNRTSVHFLQKDITDTELPNQSADAVTIVNVWHHLPNWETLMASAKEIDRILKPGGLFVVVDTHPLPESGIRRKIIERSIRRVVNPQKFLQRAQGLGVKLDAEMVEGVENFCKHDALKAFSNALTKDQFEEILRKSALAPSLQKVSELLSPHPFFKLIYPPLNLAHGVKT